MTLKLTGQRCRCTGCDEHFARVSTFSRHRVGAFGKNIRDPGTRRCLTGAEMEARGWRKDARGFWRTAPKVTGSEVLAAIAGEAVSDQGVAA